MELHIYYLNVIEWYCCLGFCFATCRVRGAPGDAYLLVCLVTPPGEDFVSTCKNQKQTLNYFPVIAIFPDDSCCGTMCLTKNVISWIRIHSSVQTLSQMDLHYVGIQKLKRIVFISLFPTKGEEIHTWLTEVEVANKC